MDKIFETIYFNPEHPAGYGGVKKLYKYANEIDSNITLNDVKNWLSKQFEYTLFKPALRNFSRNTIYSNFVNEIWEIDALYYKNYSRYNSGYKYIINVIDVFSKYLIAIPMKTLKGKDVADKFERLFKTVKPMKIRSDRGKEFDNFHFRNLCKKYGIIYYTTTNQTKKCAIVERVNKTMRLKIGRFISHRGNYRYIDNLKDLVKSYNHSIHRTTKMRPIDIDEDDEKQVFQNMYGYPNMLEILKSKQGQKKFEVGDTVRQKFDEKVLDKGTDQKWTDIVYKIRKVYNKLTKPLYAVELNGSDVNRRFYPEELQKVTVDNDSRWRIDKILRYRTTSDNIREALVRWKGYPQYPDQWIPLEAVRSR